MNEIKVIRRKDVERLGDEIVKTRNLDDDLKRLDWSMLAILIEKHQAKAKEILDRIALVR